MLTLEGCRRRLGRLLERLESPWDVLVLHPRVIHAALDCQSEKARLSVDLRFVRQGVVADSRWTSTWKGDDGF